MKFLTTSANIDRDRIKFKVSYKSNELLPRGLKFSDSVSYPEWTGDRFANPNYSQLKRVSDVLEKYKNYDNWNIIDRIADEVVIRIRTTVAKVATR